MEEWVQSMDITRGCSQPSTEGPDEYFTGNARIDPLFDPQDEARAAAVSVTFEYRKHRRLHSELRRGQVCEAYRWEQRFPVRKSVGVCSPRDTLGDRPKPGLVRARIRGSAVGRLSDTG